MGWRIRRYANGAAEYRACHLQDRGGCSVDGSGGLIAVGVEL